MKKTLVQISLLMSLPAAGLGIFCALEFFSAGVRSPEKAIILFIGLWLVFLSSLTGFVYLLIRQKGWNHIPYGTWAMVMLGAIGIGFLFSLISPLPRPHDPSNWQSIEIIPGADRDNQKVLIEEIKLDGQPLPFDEVMPGDGWSRTTSGLESSAGSAAPLLIQRKGPLEQGMSMLFASGPEYGSAAVRLGWSVSKVNAYNSQGEGQVPLEIPAADPMGFGALFTFAITMSAASGLFLLIVGAMPEEKIIGIAAAMEELSHSVTFWVAIGIVTTYFLFYFQPVFLNSSNVMQLQNGLPAIYPIGNDLHLILKSADSLVATWSPYAGANKYPPLAAGLFTTLLGVNVREAFRVLSTANLFFFLFLSIGIPLWLSKGKKLESFAWLLFAAGLFSYPFAFEVERGQFNLMAMALVMGAVLLYHRAPRLKWLAFALFCLGVQLKIYPAIFVIFFTRDWMAWKKNLLRWAGLGLANIALLLVFGWKVFSQFLSMITNVIGGLGESADPVSHSVVGFLQFVNYHLSLQPDLARGLEIALSLIVIALVAICWYLAYKRREILDPYLILACTLAALTLPSLSNDYTIAYLIGPAILFFSRIAERIRSEDQLSGWTWIPLAISALAVGSLNFSYYSKPITLQNQFPVLVILLGCAAWFSMKEP